MTSTPISLRLDKDLEALLAEGRRRTPLKKQELIRRTLRQHLRAVIEKEAAIPTGRVTLVEPLRPGVMTKTYKRLARIDRAWEEIERAATKAQGRPSWED